MKKAADSGFFHVPRHRITASSLQASARLPGQLREPLQRQQARQRGLRQGSQALRQLQERPGPALQQALVQQQALLLSFRRQPERQRSTGRETGQFCSCQM
jgi:hypothetical protein